MLTTFKGARIAGISVVVPRNISRYDDEIANYDHTPAKARKLKLVMGYDEHRIAEPGTCTSDLVVAGIRRLEEQGHVRLDEIDALVFVSQTPDYVLPPTSSVLHGKLGLREDAYCVDINSGCSGYALGLLQAFMLLQQEGVERVLLCAGDLLSARISPNDRNSYPLTGDAASITLLEKSSDEDVIWSAMMNRGASHEALIIPAGGARLPSSEETKVPFRDADGNVRSQDQLFMAGADVFNFTQSAVPDLVNEVLERSGTSKEEIDYFFLHQANDFIVKKLAERLEVPLAKVPHGIVGKYGNSNSATIPITICSTLPDGPQEPLNVVMCGFGVGLSWGVVKMKLSGFEFCSIVEY